MNPGGCPMSERCSVIVVPRDRFSPTIPCIEALLRNTPEPHELILVMGGAPERLEAELRSRYGGRAKLILEKRFLNPAEGRNLGLRASTCALAAIVDNDVVVRPGWLSALLRCQAETGADMVVPLILEAPTVIHTAGNDFYINEKAGKKHIHKVLRYMKKPFHDASNLQRQPTDYGELHCQLVTVQKALSLGVYDEKLREVGEVDSGLIWKRAGCPMWFEPASVVVYEKPSALTEPEDVRYFTWRWDMKAILEGYRHFERKWGMDVQGQGSFKFFLADLQNEAGWLVRACPCRATLAIDRVLRTVRRQLQNSLKSWGRMRAWALGFREWD